MFKNINPILSRLKVVRLERKSGQQELAKKLGWPQSHLSKVESGRAVPRLDSLLEWARALGLELVLVPREKLNLVNTMISKNAEQSMLSPAYSLDDEEGTENEEIS